MAPRKKPAYNTSQNGNITDVLKELWQAAVNFARLDRAIRLQALCAADHLLRFLSCAMNAAGLLKGQIAEPKSEYFGDTSVLEDQDEYRQVGSLCSSGAGAGEYPQERQATISSATAIHPGIAGNTYPS